MSKNFAVSTVAVAPTPATSGLLLTVQAGHGTRFLPGPLVLTPAGATPAPDNSEVVTLSSVTGDVLTLSARGVESTTARAVALGWQVAQGLTAAAFDAVVAQVAANTEAINGLGPGGQLVPTTIKTGAYTAAANQLVRVNATAGVVTITAPTNPTLGMTFAVTKTDAGSNSVLVADGTGKTFNGDANATILTKGAGGTFIYDGTNWVIGSVMAAATASGVTGTGGGSVTSTTAIAADAALTGTYAPLAVAGRVLSDVAATATTSGALVAGKHNPVDASGGARAMTLANAGSAGTVTTVEKTDSSTNAVTVTLNLRGTANATLTLPWQNEAIELLGKADGSWWPVAGHKTKSSLDAAYGPGPGSDAWLKVHAGGNLDALIVGTITRDSNGAATGAPAVWPDGTSGTYTATTVSSAFPGAVDAFTVTWAGGTTKTVTQPAVTRDPTTGAVTLRPAMTVS